MQFALPRFKISNRVLLVLGVALLLLIVVHPAMASSTSGGGLPSDDWFTKVRQSVTGPWAYSISVIALVATGATLFFGGDMNGFMRALVFLVLVLSFVVAASNTISAVTGQGAEITAWVNTVASAKFGELA
jgi:type IV secretion system protein TrbC